MKVVLLRHATRSAQSLGDSPLNAIGKRQADDLASLIAPQGPLPQPTRLIGSPKKRAQETLTPLANLAGFALEVDPRLDERHQNESGKEFENRIRQVIEEINTLSESPTQRTRNPSRREACLYLCSHLDWLETAALLIPSDLSDLEQTMPWSTASYRIFRIEDGLWVHKGSSSVAARG